MSYSGLRIWILTKFTIFGIKLEFWGTSCSFQDLAAKIRNWLHHDIESQLLGQNLKFEFYITSTFQACHFSSTDLVKLFMLFHSVLERIWIKGSYLSQWLPKGERRPPKESKSRWIEILHGGSQFTLWFLKIKNFQKISDHSEFFFAL